MNAALAPRFEHGLQTAFGLREEIERVCAEARQEQYRAVIVPSSRVAEAYDAVEGTDVKVSCLIGFPLGWSDADAKRFEIEAAVDAGAHEIEYIPSLARLKEKEYRAVLREIRDAENACDERPLKVLVEVSLWTPPELEEIVKLVLDSGARYLSSGFVGSAETVSRLRELLGPKFGLKCDLPSLEMAELALSAGADLISLAQLLRAGARNPAAETAPR